MLPPNFFYNLEVMMRSKKKSFFILPLILSGIFLINGCAASSNMNSLWQNNEIKIDGDASEWSRSIQQIPDKKISIGFRNDDKFLYVCLASEDRSKIMMITRAGLIVWFEPESGDKNKFGIKYPIAVTQSTPLKAPEMNREGKTGENIDNILNKWLEEQNEFQIINKDKFPLTALPFVNDEGIEAKLGYRSNQFVYELKVPLATNEQFSFAVDAMPGEKVTVKFETEEFITEGMRDNRSSGGGMMSPGSGSGNRSGGGKGGGGGGMRPGMGGGNMFEPLNYTVEVKLEASPIKK
jgi:uncharacterized membrane protein YgcG